MVCVNDIGVTLGINDLLSTFDFTYTICTVAPPSDVKSVELKQSNGEVMAYIYDLKVTNNTFTYGSYSLSVDWSGAQPSISNSQINTLIEIFVSCLDPSLELFWELLTEIIIPDA